MQKKGRNNSLPTVQAYNGWREGEMKRYFILWFMICVVILPAASTFAVSWSEQEAGASLRPQVKTGELVLGFYLWLRYDNPPACTELVTHWTITQTVDGVGEILVDDARPPRKSCVGLSAVSTFSSFVTPIPGAQYEATIVAEDRRNHLYHERTFHYIAPLSLPTGIVLETEDGEILDLSAVDDAEIERMAGLYYLLTGAFSQAASETTVDDFVASHVGSVDDFPVWVFVVAAPEPELSFGGLNLPIIAPPGVELAYDRFLLIYVVPSTEALDGVLAQLAEYETEFLGQILVYAGTPSTTEPATVYLHAAVWEILEAAKEEYDRRNPAEE